MKFKALIFDFYGVICNEVVDEWLSKNFALSEIKYVKNLLVRPVDTGIISEGQFFQEIGVLVNKSSMEVRNEWVNLVKINPEVVDLIISLKIKYKIYLLSNGSSSFIKNILITNHIESIFTDTIISSDISIRKPNREIFEYLIRRSDYLPNEMIFIDDRAENIKAARMLSLEAIKFRSNTQLLAKLHELTVGI